MLKSVMRNVILDLQQRLNAKYPLQAIEHLPAGFYFKSDGYCPCCERQTSFVSTNSWLREYFECTNCKCIPRERLLMEMINQLAPNWRNLAIHESSPGDRGVSVRLKNECKHYTASQYYHNQPLGTVINGYFNEDIENQTFADESFDLVITQDVMEHVFAPAKGFLEIKRTLKPGGMHIFTTPLDNGHAASVEWARLDASGNIVWNYVPEYHGNPIDSKGSPVAMKWGYDIKEFIEQHTGMKTVIYNKDDLNKGIRGNVVEVIASTKA